MLSSDTVRDESFVVAPLLLQSARELESWLDVNTDKAVAFMLQWKSVMQPCSGLPSNKKAREEMWSTYHTIRTSRKFVNLWEELLGMSTSTPPNPLLYQHLSHLLFQRQLKEKLPASVMVPKEDKPLTEEELKALRYTAGFVPHSLLKKLSKSTHPKKKELCLCLREMLDDSEDEASISQQWVIIMDRGGLKNINNKTFNFFIALEESFRRRVGMGTEYMINMSEWLCGDDAVQNKWSDLADEWEEEAKVLLDMIIELWVTVRGHSTAGAMMETHKIQNKQSLQKSKGIRAKVGGTSKGTS